MYMCMLACMFAFESLHACCLDSHVNLWMVSQVLAWTYPRKVCEFDLSHVYPSNVMGLLFLRRDVL